MSSPFVGKRAAVRQCGGLLVLCMVFGFAGWQWRAQARAGRIAAAQAGGATIVVTDTSGGTGAPGCKLRDAITAANTNTATGGCAAGTSTGTAPDIIVLPANATITLSTADNSTYGFNGLPAITSYIEIQGNGAIIERSNVLGTAAFRLFYVASGASLKITNAWLRNGLAVGGRGGNGGGGGAGMGVPLIPEDADFLPAPVSNDFLKPDGGGMAVVGSGIQDILPASPGSHRGIDDMIGSASTYGNPFPPNHPLGDLSNPSGAAIPTARDDIPEIHGAYTPPQPRPAAPVDDPRGAVQVSPGAIQQGVRSWDLLHGGGTNGNDIKSVNISSAPPASIPRGGRASQEVSDPAGHRAEAMGGSPAGTKADQEAAKPQCSERGADGATEQLVREFLTGAGVPDLELAVVSPALMRLFGQLLRESLAGALDLLAARAVAKREMRATHTVIVAQDNNPLKHSPNVEVALSLLLSPPARGYMTPVRAVREAFDDLRAHQYAFVEAMRTAMNGLIARFDPAQLEKRIADKSVFDAIPARRKLKLWGQYEELFAAISREAEDDFHSLFGDRFVRAYEENLERLARDRSASGNRS